MRIAFLSDTEWVLDPYDGVIREEIRALLDGEFEIEFPEDAHLRIRGSDSDAQSLLDSLLARPDTDLIVALGPGSTHALAQHPALSKPCFGTTVIERELQGFPLTDAGTSRQTNLTYLVDDLPLSEILAGTSIEHSDKVVKRIEEKMQAEFMSQGDSGPGIVDWVTYVGEGGPRFNLGYNAEQPASFVAAMLINADSREAILDTAPRLEDWCNETFPNPKATVRALQSGPSSWPPVQVQISGRELGPLFDIVDSVKEKLLSLEGTRLIDDDWGAEAKKLVVHIDQVRARRAGLSSQDVAVSLQSYLSGIDATEFREGEELIPITLRSSVRGRTEIGELESINVASQSSGASVPLKQIADVEAVWEPGVIRRRDRLRTVTVEAAPTSGITAADINAQLQPWLEQQSETWEHGYSGRFADGLLPLWLGGGPMFEPMATRCARTSGGGHCP